MNNFKITSLKVRAKVFKFAVSFSGNLEALCRPTDLNRQNDISDILMTCHTISFKLGNYWTHFSAIFDK